MVMQVCVVLTNDGKVSSADAFGFPTAESSDAGLHSGPSEHIIFEESTVSRQTPHSIGFNLTPGGPEA